MSSHPNPIGPHARRTWWPSAATCAFLASGLEIFWLVLSRWQLSRAMKFAGGTPSPDLYAGLVIDELIGLLGIAIEATALWGVGRRQRAVAPVSVRLGQWAIATHVVV